MGKRITVLGATGFTGSIICEKLTNLGKKFSIAGRNLEKLNALNKEIGGCNEIIQIDVLNSCDIENMLDRTDILVNCVGPYNYYSKEIVAKAAMREIIYLDITGEQEFVRISLDEHHVNAMNSKATIIHSISFESALADIMAAKLIEGNKSYRDISSFYHLESARPSPGTRSTMKLARNFPTYIYSDSKFKQVGPLEIEQDIKFEQLPEMAKAFFSPYPEVLFYPKLYNTQNAASYLLMSETQASMARATKKQNNQDSDKIIKQSERSNYLGPVIEERKNHRFHLIVRAIDLDESVKHVMLTGKDMYDITASLIVYAINYIEGLENIPTGVLTPSELFDEPTFFDKFENDKLEITYW